MSCHVSFLSVFLLNCRPEGWGHKALLAHPPRRQSVTQIKFNEKSVQHNQNLFLMALLLPKAGSAPSTTHLTHTWKVRRWVNYHSKSMRVGEPGKAHPGTISGSLNLNFVTTFLQSNLRQPLLFNKIYGSQPLLMWLWLWLMIPNQPNTSWW